MQNIKISNFRKIKDTWDLDLAPITFFTGKNSSGKSSVFKGMMVLNDFVNSDNHFFLMFDGELSAKHSISSFQEAKNWYNQGAKEIHFEYVNNGNLIQLTFEDSDDIDYYKLKREFHQHPEMEVSFQNKILRGILKSLKITRSDNATFSVSRISRFDYQLEVDADIIDYDHKTPNLSVSKMSPLDNEIFSFRHKLVEEFSLKYLDNLEDFFDITFDPQVKTSRKYIDALERIRKLISTKEKQMISESNPEKNYYSPQFNLLEQFDTNKLTFNNIIVKTLLTYFEGGDLHEIEQDDDIEKVDDLGSFDKRSETRKLLKFSDWVMEQLKFEIFHLSPNRANQTKVYDIRNRETDINELLFQYNKSPFFNDTTITVLEDCLKYFGVDHKFEITNIEENLYTIKLYNDSGKRNLKDQGYGIGQLFSIFFQVALVMKERLRHNQDRKQRRRIVIIEEPEANLHPELQSHLTEFFYDMYSIYGIHFILETHSEYMIRKSQLLSLKRKIFKLYYFDGNGPYEMKYMENGTFDRGFGEGFFGVGSDLAFNLTLKNFK